MTTIKTSHSPARPLRIHLLLLAKRRDLPCALCSACNASIARECVTAIVPGPNAHMHLTRKQSYGGSRRGAESRPSTMSADAAGTELHADPGTGGPAGLGDRVFPGALAAAAHHQQIAVTKVIADRGAAAARPQREPARGAERHDGHHRVLGGAAADGVPVPGDAVPAVPVQAQPGRAQRL